MSISAVNCGLNMNENLYEGREQSLIKHLILQRYLERFAFIIGSWKESITYIDCFSGPWKSKSESYDDTSFAIVIKQLRAARTALALKGKAPRLRALFIERDRGAYAQLQKYAQGINDVEIATLNADLEDSIDKITGFIHQDAQTFPFIFIDPKGWSGFSLDVIRPLLQMSPCEVLINFMTQHIVRFINNEASQESFERLFGSKDFRDRLAGTDKEDRVDAAVFEYRNAVSSAGDFEFPGIAAILNPIKSRSHFHLIYLTRSSKGLEVFKGAEKKSMEDMESARANAEQKRRESLTGQMELFGAENAPESDYFQSLRDRYRGLAAETLTDMLDRNVNLPFDDAWKLWLRFPMTWESDLKAWIAREKITITGIEAGKRVPMRGKNHLLAR